MWVTIDPSEVHQPGGRYQMNLETGRQEKWVEDKPDLTVDADAIGRFVDALFRYADPQTYVSLRGFPDTVEGPPFAIIGQQVGDAAALATAAAQVAQTCAHHREPIVFCPPVATFDDPDKATQKALANGLSLSVECDQGAQKARRDLEALLGPATVAVESGGEWADQDGELHPKMHLHWRLDKPTRTVEEHAQLRRARDLATFLVGGDPTNKTAVHPIRWPGSWHKKKSPKLARIAELTEHELSLPDALARLEAAVAERGGVPPARKTKKASAQAKKPAAAQDDPDALAPMPGEKTSTAELLGNIMRGEQLHDSICIFTARHIAKGWSRQECLETMQETMKTHPPEARDGRWQARYRDIGRSIDTAVAKFQPKMHEDTNPEGTKPAGDEWRSRLQKTDKGLKGNLFNARLVLSHADEWRGRLGLNEFTDRIMWRLPPPWHKGPFTSRQITDSDYIDIAVRLQAMEIQVSSHIAAEAALSVAVKNRFDPIADYLNQLTWDGTPRIDTWLHDYLGAEDTAYVRAVAAKSLIAAVARVRMPGCQVDTVPVLEGAQGIGKSSALRALFGSQQFTDHMPDLCTKDAALQLQGIWCVEFAELDKLSSAESARAKAFITTRFDRYRRPYGRVTDDVARRCVFWATLNPGGSGYLRDETGNRRYWPTSCGIGWPAERKVDVEGLEAIRDQLWAEASFRFVIGETHWLNTAELEATQVQVAAQRFAEDVWAEPIRRFVEERSEVSVAEVLGECLFKYKGQWTRHDQMRVAAALTAMGLVRKQVRAEGGNREWRYFHGDRVVPLSPTLAVSPTVAA